MVVLDVYFVVVACMGCTVVFVADVVLLLVDKFVAKVFEESLSKIFQTPLLHVLQELVIFQWIILLQFTRRSRSTTKYRL